MLPPGLWAAHEPRAVLPIFAGMRNIVDFSVQPSFSPGWRTYAQPLYWLYRRRKDAASLVRDYRNLVLRRRLSFRGAFLSRGGEFLCELDFARGLGVGDFFLADVSKSIEGAGVPGQDGLLVLIANRGRTDLWSSSPGSVNVRYVGDRSVCGFRVGLFARILNPADSVRHFGFTGLNPQIRLGSRDRPAILLMNHSSDPEYDRPVSPVIRLHRTHDEWIEGPFGPIAPHGALERGIYDLFPEADEFAGTNKDRAYAVTRAQGASLASLHLIRSDDGSSMAIEHSRPAHTNVVAYF
jgi:hypothetical protein